MLFIDEISQINDHKDLSEFIQKLRYEYQTKNDDWENITLESYLEAMAAWVFDYYENQDQSGLTSETWRTMAFILYAAKGYE